MDKLSIVNGMAMYTVIKEGKLNISGDVVPFNDAMCQGEVTEEIFSSEFIEERAIALGVLREEYEEIVIAPLNPLFHMEYDEIDLYFDEDMFCMINLVTVLAYLDRNEYEGKVTLNIIDYDYNVIKSASIVVSGFYQLYITTIVRKIALDIPLPKELHRGIMLYLDYAKGMSKVHEIINNNPRMDRERLLSHIMKCAPEYGLGDTQITALIESMRSLD